MRVKYLCFVLLLTVSLAHAATLQGTVYNMDLDPEVNVLIEVDSVQKTLSKDGSYSFDLSQGSHIVTARKDDLQTEEEIKIVDDGIYIVDLFLLPGFAEEDDLWKGTEENFFGEEETEQGYEAWRYIIGGIIVVFALFRFSKKRRKYGSLRKFKKKQKAEAGKTIDQHKEDLANEPGYIDQALEIIKKQDGRITQKELRKEMLYLSEAKISLIVTELEHKGLIEKVKKGRGNVLLLKE